MPECDEETFLNKVFFELQAERKKIAKKMNGSRSFIQYDQKLEAIISINLN